MIFYIALGLQLVGLSTVSLCLFTGITQGDYGRGELLQLVGGSALFYLGQLIKTRPSRS